MRLNAARALRAGEIRMAEPACPQQVQFLRPPQRAEPGTCPISCSTRRSNVPCASSKATSAVSKNIRRAAQFAGGPDEARRPTPRGVPRAIDPMPISRPKRQAARPAGSSSSSAIRRSISPINARRRFLTLFTVAHAIRKGRGSPDRGLFCTAYSGVLVTARQRSRLPSARSSTAAPAKPRGHKVGHQDKRIRPGDCRRTPPTECVSLVTRDCAGACHGLEMRSACSSRA